jgi:hypothetical protein
MSAWTDPEVHRWTFDPLPQLRVVDILCVQNNAVGQISSGHGLILTAEKLGTAFRPEPIRCNNEVPSVLSPSLGGDLGNAKVNVLHPIAKLELDAQLFSLVVERELEIYAVEVDERGAVLLADMLVEIGFYSERSAGVSMDDE